MKVFGFLFDPDNKYGRICSKIKVIVLANLMFLVCSLPVITIGAAWTSLYHVMMKEERCPYTVNPVTEFWRTFRREFRQSTIAWLVVLLLALLGVADIFLCRLFSGMFLYMEAGIWLIVLLLIAAASFLFPVIAAFSNRLPVLAKNAACFMLKNPLITFAVVLINVVPIALTFLDQVNQPTYVFCWFFFGFGLQAFINSKMFLSLFTPYLPLVNQNA